MKLKNYLKAIKDNKTAQAKFNDEIAKREAKGLTKEEATYEAGYQAYCLFNYYAKECEYLEASVNLLEKRLNQARSSQGVYTWHGELKASS